MNLNQKKLPNHEDNIKLWFSKLSPECKKKTVVYLTFQYYKYLGLTANDGVQKWLDDSKNGIYPNYNSAHLIIKKLIK